MVKSKAAALALIGELRESLRLCTGEDVREGIDRGGGEENLRHSLGDLLFKGSVPHAPWLVAKNSSNDLEEEKSCLIALSLTRVMSTIVSEWPVLVTVFTWTGPRQAE